ncbi:MAG: hypothetical protein LBN30_08725 [Oscillospiraceae bacterium]|jgi:hypothetical protein|nr:hypothetical protein [Oscillospiraceae bacterium]
MLDNEIQNAHACPVLGTKYALVGVPVTIKPFAIPGPISVECYGEPIITDDEHCHGKVGQVCHFTIAQKIKIEIPVDFGAAVKVGETFVDCDICGDGGCGNKPSYPDNGSKPGYPDNGSKPNYPDGGGSGKY